MSQNQQLKEEQNLKPDPDLQQEVPHHHHTLDQENLQPTTQYMDSKPSDLKQHPEQVKSLAEQENLNGVYSQEHHQTQQDLKENVGQQNQDYEVNMNQMLDGKDSHLSSKLLSSKIENNQNQKSNGNQNMVSSPTSNHHVGKMNIQTNGGVNHTVASGESNIFNPMQQTNQSNSQQHQTGKFEQQNLAQKETLDRDEQEEENGDGFFLTGVNMAQNQQQKQDNLQQEENNELELQEVDPFKHIDKYKLLGIVDSKKAFSNNDCVIVSEKQSTITHLNVNNKMSFKFDSLISSYQEVNEIASRLAHNFLTIEKFDKIVLNIVDQFNSNNNTGFNLANFKMRFMNNFFQEVVADYEKSLIGSFSTSLIQMLNTNPQFKDLELYFTITKFENDMGFSLIQQNEDLQEQLNQHEQEQEAQFQQQIPQEGTVNIDAIDTLEKTQSNNEAMSQQQNQPLNENIIKPLFSQQPNPSTVTAGGIQTNPNSNQQSLSPRAMNPQEQYNLLQQNEKRKEILKQGQIPEFIRVKEMHNLYTAFTQANLKNRILQQRKINQQSRPTTGSGQGTQQSMQQQAAQQQSNFDTFKDDIILFQFKIVRKNSVKTLSTISFINMPLSKSTDQNVSTLTDILLKFKNEKWNKRNLNVTQMNNDFIPYNKSILTRIIAPQLQKNNTLFLTHYSKKSLQAHLDNNQHAGQGKGLFLFTDKLTSESRMVKTKLSEKQALNFLQKKFASDVNKIFSEINKFREGLKSLEVFTQQTSSQLQMSDAGAHLGKTSQLTMFHQILYYLNLKEQIEAHNGEKSSLHERNIPEDEIQKVIFDKQYIKYLNKKVNAQQQAQNQQNIMINQPSATGLSSNARIPSGKMALSEKGIGSNSNYNINQFQQLHNQNVANAQSNQKMQMNKLQFVQYECIKSELKESYDKKILFLNKRLNQQKAFQDPSFILLSHMTQQQHPKGSKTKTIASPQDFGGLNIQGASSTNYGNKNNRQGNQNQYMRHSMKTFSSNNNKKGGYSNNGQENQMTLKQQQNQQKEQYYKFYLESAQKAIDMMRQQHRSASQMRLLESHKQQTADFNQQITTSQQNIDANLNSKNSLGLVNGQGSNSQINSQQNLSNYKPGGNGLDNINSVSNTQLSGTGQTFSINNQQRPMSYKVSASKNKTNLRHREMGLAPKQMQLEPLFTKGFRYTDQLLTYDQTSQISSQQPTNLPYNQQLDVISEQQKQANNQFLEQQLPTAGANLGGQRPYIQSANNNNANRVTSSSAYMGSLNPQTTKSSQNFSKLGGGVQSNSNIQQNRIQTAKQQYQTTKQQNFMGKQAHKLRSETANTASNVPKLPNPTAAQRRAKLQNLGNHLKQVAGTSTKQKQYMPLRAQGVLGVNAQTNQYGLANDGHPRFTHSKSKSRSRSQKKYGGGVGNSKPLGQFNHQNDNEEQEYGSLNPNHNIDQNVVDNPMIPTIKQVVVDQPETKTQAEIQNEHMTNTMKKHDISESQKIKEVNEEQFKTNTEYNTTEQVSQIKTHQKGQEEGTDAKTKEDNFESIPQQDSNSKKGEITSDQKGDTQKQLENIKKEVKNEYQTVKPNKGGEDGPIQLDNFKNESSEQYSTDKYHTFNSRDDKEMTVGQKSSNNQIQAKNVGVSSHNHNSSSNYTERFETLKPDEK